MLNAEEQIEVLALVSSTKNLILSEQEKAEVTVKGAADYVTNVDVAVQEFLKRELAERFPDVRMLAEEQVNTGFVKEGKYWILDPIDGTTNLIRDMKLSAVALGYYENGEITFGAVYNPFMDELFHASLGGGAWLNGKRITVAHDRELKDAVIAFGHVSGMRRSSTQRKTLPYLKNCSCIRRTSAAPDQRSWICAISPAGASRRIWSAT